MRQIPEFAKTEWVAVDAPGSPKAQALIPCLNHLLRVEIDVAQLTVDVQKKFEN